MSLLTSMPSSRVPRWRISSLQNHRIFLCLIVLVGALARLHELDLYALNGDEYNSIQEATAVGMNWNGIVYHVLMNSWIKSGQSDFWLRLPAVMFGILAIPVFYQLGRHMADKKVGIFSALLSAIAPFSIYHSQEVRFYSLFIFASALFMLTSLMLIRRNGHRQYVKLLAAVTSALLLIGSHFFGLLALIVQSAFALVAAETRWPRWQRTIMVLTVLILAFLLPLLPFIQDLLLQIYVKVGNVTSVPQQLFSPLSPVNAAKAALAAYFFAFGYQVYPGSFFIVGPGLLIIGTLLLFGSKRMLATWWSTFLLIYALGLFAVYFPLDAAGGTLAGGIAPRHAAFVWPAFILLLAMGLAQLRSTLQGVLLVGIVAMNFMTLLPRWQHSEWTYGTLTDFHHASSLAADWSPTNPLVIYDGRSRQPIERYFPDGLSQLPLETVAADQSTTRHFDHLLFVSNNHYQSQRIQLDQLQAQLERQYSWLTGYVDYPLFQYVLRRSNTIGYHVDEATGQIHHPLRRYGIQFQDLRLPVSVSIGESSFQIVGSFFLPDPTGKSAQPIPLQNSHYGSQLLLLSNVFDSKLLDSQEIIAEAVVTTSSNQTWILPIRLREHTENWSGECQKEAPCQTVHRWHKRIALVSGSAYPGAWRDFQAGIYAASLAFPEPAEVEHIEIRYLQDTGQLYIWGMAILP